MLFVPGPTLALAISHRHRTVGVGWRSYTRPLAVAFALALRWVTVRSQPSHLRRMTVTDTTPPPRSNDPANDGHELDNDVRDAGHSVGEKVRAAGHHAGDKARSVAGRISDAVEDVIPGDSDHDGH